MTIDNVFGGLLAIALVGAVLLISMGAAWLISTALAVHDTAAWLGGITK